jgi:hypothetical protein
MPKYNDDTLSRAVQDVVSRAESIYPRLVSRRADIAAELARVDDAIAQLEGLKGTLGSARARPPAAPSVARSRPRGQALTARKLEQPVLAALGQFKGPVGSAEILEALSAKGLSVRPYPLQTALKRLRDEGHIRASGKARRFKYEIASGPRGA